MVRCSCAMCDTDTDHWPAGGEPLAVATMDVSFDDAVVAAKEEGADSAVAAADREASVTAKLEIVLEAD